MPASARFAGEAGRIFTGWLQSAELAILFIVG